MNIGIAEKKPAYHHHNSLINIDYDYINLYVVFYLVNVMLSIILAV